MNKKYKMKKEKPKIRQAVFIITYTEEKDKILYLILKRKKHWKGYEFPKGGVDSGETAIQTAKREVFEETGQKPIKVKKYPIKGVYRYPQEFPDRPGVLGQNYTLFSAEIKKSKIKIDKREHLGYEWMDFNQAIKKLTFDNQKKCLRYVNKRLR